MTSRRRLTDSDVEALMSGHTPPDRPDLAATASFLRELPAQLSESEPIELAAPPRRRTRLLVAVVASVVAVVGLAGVVTLRGGEDVVRPAVGGASQVDVTTIAVPLTTTVLAATANAGVPDTNAAAPATATTVAPQPGVLTGPMPAMPSDSPGATSTSVFDDSESPVARYARAVLAWNQCVTVKGEAACGAKPEPAEFGIVTSTSVAPNAVAPAQPTAPVSPDTTSPCAGRTSPPPPGLVHPGGLTC